MSPIKLQSHHLWWQGPKRLAWLVRSEIDVALPEDSLKEAKRLNNSVQLDHRTLVSINNHEDKTQKHQSVVYLSAREPAILNHNQEKTSATAKAAEKEEADNQEGKKEPQQHLQNSLNPITPIEWGPRRLQ